MKIHKTGKQQLQSRGEKMGNRKLDGEYCKYNIYFVYLFESPNLIFLLSKKRLEQVSPKKKFKKKDGREMPNHPL